MDSFQELDSFHRSFQMEFKMDQFPPEAIMEIGQNFPVKSGTYWVKCPYDANHRTLNTKYMSHVDKCRRNYCIAMRAIGERKLTRCCTYNPDHEVLAPELMYHEYSCEDKKKGMLDNLFYLIYEDTMQRAAKTAAGKAEEEPEEKTKELETLEHEIRAVFGMTFDELVECLHKKFLDYEKQQDLEGEVEILWADPAHHEHGIHPFKQDWNFADQPVVTPRSRQLTVARRTPKLSTIAEEKPFPVKKKDGDGDGDGDDSEEAWTSGNDPTFCWLQSQQVHRPLSFRVPVGLSKAQRKKYQKCNAKVLKYEYGVFPENEDKSQEKAKLPKTMKYNVYDEEDVWP